MPVGVGGVLHDQHACLFHSSAHVRPCIGCGFLTSRPCVHRYLCISSSNRSLRSSTHFTTNNVLVRITCLKWWNLWRSHYSFAPRLRAGITLPHVLRTAPLFLPSIVRTRLVSRFLVCCSHLKPSHQQSNFLIPGRLGIECHLTPSELFPVSRLDTDCHLVLKSVFVKGRDFSSLLTTRYGLCFNLIRLNSVSSSAVGFHRLTHVSGHSLVRLIVISFCLTGQWTFFSSHVSEHNKISSHK